MRNREAFALPFSEEIVSGWMAIMALMYWPVFICIVAGKSLSTAIAIWGVLLLFMLIFTLIDLKRHPMTLGFTDYLKRWVRGISFAEVLAVICVLFHAYITFKYMHIDDDDSVYIAAATTALDTNTLLKYNPLSGMPLTALNESDAARQVTAPLFAFYAAVCRLFGLRPAVFAHTWYPPILTCYFYIAMAVLGRELFDGDRKKTSLFVMFSYLVNMTAYYSIYTGGTFLMIRSWQGKAQFVGAAVPMLLAFYLHVAKQGDMKKADMIYLLLLFQASSMLTSMGTYLGSILSAIFGFTASVYAKEKNIFFRTCCCLVLPVLIMGLYLVIKRRGGLI